MNMNDRHKDRVKLSKGNSFNKKRYGVGTKKRMRRENWREK